LQVIVRDNNVDQALRILKKKLQREGVFREMKRRKAYEKPSERKTREKAEAIRRARKAARKQAQREGLIPMPKSERLRRVERRRRGFEFAANTLWLMHNGAARSLRSPPAQGGREQIESAACADSNSPKMLQLKHCRIAISKRGLCPTSRRRRNRTRYRRRNWSSRPWSCARHRTAAAAHVTVVSYHDWRHLGGGQLQSGHIRAEHCERALCDIVRHLQQAF
jgi:small subunit ribosomal protein S21